MKHLTLSLLLLLYSGACFAKATLYITRTDNVKIFYGTSKLKIAVTEKSSNYDPTRLKGENYEWLCKFSPIDKDIKVRCEARNAPEYLYIHSRIQCNSKGFLDVDKLLLECN